MDPATTLRKAGQLLMTSEFKFIIRAVALGHDAGRFSGFCHTTSFHFW